LKVLPTIRNNTRARPNDPYYYGRCSDAGIARGDELFEAERVEVECEIPKEVALKWVVAVAKNRLASQLPFVVLQLIFDIAKLRVKLVLVEVQRLMEYFAV